jgi:NifB/MoaA-like Fe-S oxidoreductase
VLIKEDDGSWLPLVSTDVHLSTKEILESYGKRFGIEEMFKDLKEVWGWGKQEVRKLESNEGTCLFCFPRLRAKTQRISRLVLTCTVFERVYF